MIIVLLAAGGCGGDDGADAVQGVTDDEIVIGNYSPQSGPAAVFGSATRVMGAYADFVNDGGGINGRQIRFVIRDDQFDPSRTVSVVRQLNEEDEVFAICGGIGSSTTNAALPYLEENGIPLVPVGGGDPQFTAPVLELVFSVNPSYIQEGQVMASYALNELGAERVAIFYQNDAVGEAGLDGINEVLDDAGIEPVAQVAYERGDTDFSAQARELSDADPDIIMLFSFPAETAQLRKDAAQVGIDTAWITSLLLADPVMFELAGVDNWNDTYVLTYQPPVTDVDDPKIQAYLDFMAEYAPDEPVGANTANGYGFMELCVEGLRRAGDDLTRESYLEALESIEGWSDGINPNVTLGSDDHRAVEDIAIMQARDGQYELITDFQHADEWGS